MQDSAPHAAYQEDSPWVERLQASRPQSATNGCPLGSTFVGDEKQRLPVSSDSVGFQYPPVMSVGNDSASGM